MMITSGGLGVLRNMPSSGCLPWSPPCAAGEACSQMIMNKCAPGSGYVLDSDTGNVIAPDGTVSAGGSPVLWIDNAAAPVDVAVPLATIQNVIAESGIPSVANKPVIGVAPTQTLSASSGWVMWLAVAAVAGVVLWQWQSRRGDGY